jgi:hypothetical protein
VTWTSSIPIQASTTDKAGAAANAATDTHTHNVTYTISTQSAIPTYRFALIGKKLPPFLTQSNYRWYANTNGDTPTTTLAALNTSTTIADATVYRLRMDVNAATSTLSQLNNFKLQFATSTGGPWQDVGKQASSTIWRGFDNVNATTTDGLTITSLLIPSSTVKETYQEQTPATSTPNGLVVGDYGEWDWVLQSNGVAAGTNYFFRMTYNNSTPTLFDLYQNYAAVTSPPPVITCSTNIASTTLGALSSLSIATAPNNASTTMSCGTDSLGCTLSINDAGNGASPGLATTSPAYLIPSITGILTAGTEGYGVQGATTTIGSGATLSLGSIFANAGNNVGALSLTTKTLASSTAALTNREIVITHKAAIAATTQSGNYNDTITYSCFGN